MAEVKTTAAQRDAIYAHANTCVELGLQRYAHEPTDEQAFFFLTRLLREAALQLEERIGTKGASQALRIADPLMVPKGGEHE